MLYDRSYDKLTLCRGGLGKDLIGEPGARIFAELVEVEVVDTEEPALLEVRLRDAPTPTQILEDTIL